MTFKQFKQWCNGRACDGCWGSHDALYCINLIENMKKIPWWKRKRVWKKIEHSVIYAVVNPINKKIQDALGAKMEGGNEDGSAQV